MFLVDSNNVLFSRLFAYVLDAVKADSHEQTLTDWEKERKGLQEREVRTLFPLLVS